MKIIYASRRRSKTSEEYDDVLGFFTNQADAERVAFGGGATGYEPGAAEEWPLYESFEDFERERPFDASASSKAYRRAELRRSALAKLSKEERAALGL